MRDEHDLPPIESELSIAGERPSDNLARPLGAKRWLAVGASGVVMAMALALAVGTAGDGGEVAAPLAVPEASVVREAAGDSATPAARVATLVAVAPAASSGERTGPLATAPSTPVLALARTVDARPATSTPRRAAPASARGGVADAPRLSPLTGLPLPEEVATLDTADSRGDDGPIDANADEPESTPAEALVAERGLGDGEEATEPVEPAVATEPEVAPATQPDAAEDAPPGDPGGAEAPL